MKKHSYFVKFLCLLLVSVFLTVSTSATDVITPDFTEPTALITETIQPRAGCSYSVTVSGQWIEVWNWSETILIDAFFNPGSVNCNGVYVNGHSHKGTLTYYEGVNPYATNSGYRTVEVQAEQKVYRYYDGATALFKGTITCVP